MRTIKKSPPPPEHVTWCQSCRLDPNFGYELLPHKSLLIQAMLGEQGWLCAYTERRINPNTCHIEHLKPQSLSRHEGAPDETVDYGNMVLCLPSPNSPKLPYGAQKKDDWHDPALFASPLNPASSSRFRYSSKGKIAASQDGDTAAETTIQKLGLDHADLADLRAAQIAGVWEELGHITDRKALRRAITKQLTGLRQSDLELPEFVSAKIQRLEKALR